MTASLSVRRMIDPIRRVGQRGVLLAVLGLVAVTGCGTGAGDSEDVQYAPVFCVQPSPVGHDLLGRLAFVSGAETWTTAFDPSGPTVAHRVDGHWTVVHLPRPRARSSAVYDVSGIGDVWAVGAAYPNGSDDRSAALVEHWSAKQWRIVPTPHLAVQKVVLRAVVEISRNNVWAVGGYGNRAGPAFPLRMLAEHWDGRRWRVVPMPTPGRSENGLEALAWDSPTSLWTVGSLDNGHGFLEHWNGHRWSISQTPDVPGSATFDAVLATGTTDVWIAGTITRPGGRHTTALFDHWDGHTWTRVPAPATPNADPSLTSLAARVPQDIWAAGSIRSDGHPYTQPLVMHWDGSHWSIAATPHFRIPAPVGSPDPEWASAAFDGIAIQGGGRPWVVGYRPSGQGAQEAPLVAASCHAGAA